MYLTDGERTILIFLMASALIGAGMNYYKKAGNKVTVKVTSADTAWDDKRMEDLVKEAKIVNINTADEQKIERLPGIGPSLAREIVHYRKTCGLFKNIEDLNKVKGIGPKKLSAIREYLTLDEARE